jgi:hypothetical protein
MITGRLSVIASTKDISNSPNPSMNVGTLSTIALIIPEISLGIC